MNFFKGMIKGFGMKFLESTNFFVRTIMFDFINRDTSVKLKFRLIPVIHIGSKEFYDNISENLDQCDEVFYEGVKLKKLKYISKCYRSIAKKLDLVTQRDTLKLNELKVKLTHADLTIETGVKEWNELRFIEKLKAKYYLPVKLYFEGKELTRERLAKKFMTSHEEMYLAYGPREDEEKTFRNLIMNEREQIVFEKIKNRLDFESNENKVIGILYGAGHMKSIARYLIDKHNYIPVNGKFMKVFNVESSY